MWQPQVECNLASPLLTSILDVLRLVVDAGMSDVLPKVFAIRRPQVAPWWIGVLLLGDPGILGQITRYLETLEERYSFGWMARPDPVVAAWTGVPQSFLDTQNDTSK